MSNGDCYPYGKRYYVPIYIWCILVILLILLFLVSISLIYVLIKTKFFHDIINRCKNKNTLTPEKLETQNVSSQTWERKSVKRLNLDINKCEVTEDENNRTLRRQDGSVTSTADFNTLQAPKKTGGSGNVSPNVIKAVMKDMPIIKPEQMSEICREVLKRRNLAEDTSSSLLNIDQLAKENTSDIKVESKYASTPELDVYDVIPTRPRNIKTTAENDYPDINEKPSSNKSNESPEPNCDIYDFPKESNSNALKVSDIYDSPLNEKIKIQSGYVIPYFSLHNLSLAFKQREERPNYALLAEVPSEQNARNSKTEVQPKRIIIEEEYDVPKELLSEAQMYINANDNLFTDSSTVTEK